MFVLVVNVRFGYSILLEFLLLA